jgi:hypothetical protein
MTSRDFCLHLSYFFISFMTVTFLLIFYLQLMKPSLRANKIKIENPLSTLILSTNDGNTFPQNLSSNIKTLEGNLIQRDNTNKWISTFGMIHGHNIYSMFC